MACLRLTTVNAHTDLLLIFYLLLKSKLHGNTFCLFFLCRITERAPIPGQNTTNQVKYCSSKSLCLTSLNAFCNECLIIFLLQHKKPQIHKKTTTTKSLYGSTQMPLSLSCSITAFTNMQLLSLVTGTCKGSQPICVYMKC